MMMKCVIKADSNQKKLDVIEQFCKAMIKHAKKELENDTHSAWHESTLSTCENITEILHGD